MRADTINCKTRVRGDAEPWRKRGVDAKLAGLRALRDADAAPETLADMRRALSDPSNLVAAEAAQIIGARGWADLEPELVAAFDRFMVEPETTDKLCRAKLAIVEALNKIDYHGADVFLRGIHHVQMEAAWGEPVDAAAPLRGSSAFGLVRIGYPQVIVLLVDLLADRWKVARIGAVQAIANSGSVAAVPLLRFKARAGDREAEVIGECLTALVNLAPAESLPFVAEFLDAPDESVQAGAALALGESRRPEALQILKAFWSRAQMGAVQESVLLATAMLRLPAALDFLLEVVAGPSQAAALAALAALAIHRHSDPLRERIATTLATKGDAALLARFKKKFDGSK